MRKSATKNSEPAGPTSWLHRLLLICFGLSLAVAGIAGLEVTFRLAGVGDPYSYEDPFVGFAPGRDLFVLKTLPSGESVFTTSPEKLAFFNQQQFPAEKAADTYRIFTLGGSTTAGRPYDAKVAFARWLELYLAAAAPSRRYEVINAGAISYASYRVALLMQELLRYEPDLFIVYTGHNEFLEERTYSKIIHQSPGLRRLRLALNALRTYTLARNALFGSRPPATGATTLGGEVRTQLDGWTGLELYHRDQALQRAVVEHFEYNLRQMAASARAHGVDLVFVLPVSNLKDFSPFKSEHRAGLSVEERESFGRLLAEGQRLLRAGQPQAAHHTLGRAAAIDPEYAEVHFRMGRSLMAMGRNEAARKVFLRAKDLDIAPLRALETQVRLLEDVARSYALPVIDLPAILAAESRQRLGHRVLGKEFLLDHVHPDIPVHSLIAERLLALLVEQGLAVLEPTWSAESKQVVYDRLVSTLDARYYAERDLNLAKVLGWAGQLEEAEAPLLRAAAVLVDEPEVALNLGILHQRAGRLEQAASELQRAVELMPGSPEAHFNLGVVLGQLDNPTDGIGALEQAIRLRPDYPEAHFNLGLLLRGSQRGLESVAALRRAQVLRPGSARILRNLGLAHRDLGQLDEALSALGRSVELEPEDVQTRTDLAATLSLQGKVAAAADELEKAIALKPDNAEAHFRLGRVNAQRGLEGEAVAGYLRALAADPDHSRAHNNLGILLAKQGKLDEAALHLERAIGLDSGYADAHFNLGIVRDGSGKPGAAIGAMERALELDPENGRYHYALGMLLEARGRSQRSRHHFERARAAGVDAPPETPGQPGAQ